MGEMTKHLTALVGYLAAWEDSEGAMAAMMPHEYGAFMDGLKTLAIRHSPREARNELRALPSADPRPSEQTCSDKACKFYLQAKDEECSCTFRPERRVAQRSAWVITNLNGRDFTSSDDRRKPTERQEEK